jgi:hypothetical protein
MKTSITIPKLMLLAGILFSGAMILNSCSKSDSLNAIANANNAAAPKATTGILDRDLKIAMAKDGNTDITADFNFITFNFKSTSAATGYADAWNDVLAVRGTWSMNAGYNMITMGFPTVPLSQLAFMNREWIISESSTNVTLISGNGDGDQVYLTGK